MLENWEQDLGQAQGCTKGGQVVPRGLSPGPHDLGAILSSAVTLQCFKGLKEKLQFKRKTLHALFAYEWHLYN